MSKCVLLKLLAWLQAEAIDAIRGTHPSPVFGLDIEQRKDIAIPAHNTDLSVCGANDYPRVGLGSARIGDAGRGTGACAVDKKFASPQACPCGPMSGESPNPVEDFREGCVPVDPAHLGLNLSAMRGCWLGLGNEDSLPGGQGFDRSLQDQGAGIDQFVKELGIVVPVGNRNYFAVEHIAGIQGFDNALDTDTGLAGAAKQC